MSLGDDIREEFKADAETILEDNFRRAKGLFKYHEDGSIQLSDEVRDAPGRIGALVYLIAKRFMYEAEDSESATLSNEFFYDKFDVADSSIRGYLMQLRKAGVVRSENSEHEVIVENLPQAFDIIEEQIGD